MKMFIIQTLSSEAKCKTGQGIFDHLELLKRTGQITNDHFFINAETTATFQKGIEFIKENISKDEDICIYVDSHGYADGRGFSIGREYCIGWDDLLFYFEPIRTKIGKHSILGLGLCNGQGIDRIVSTDFPFEYVITTTQVVTSQDIEPAFGLFFEKVVNNLDIESMFSQIFKERVDSKGKSKFIIIKRP